MAQSFLPHATEPATVTTDESATSSRFTLPPHLISSIPDSTFLSRLSSKCRRHLSSRSHSWMLAFMLILNCILLIWEVVMMKNEDQATPPLFLFIEVVIIIAFSAEIVLRFLAERMMFWYSCSNVFDLLVFSCSLLATFLSNGGATLIIRIDELVTSLMLVLRYITAFSRILIIIKNKARQRQAKVDLKKLSPEFVKDAQRIDGAASSSDEDIYIQVTTPLAFDVSDFSVESVEEDELALFSHD